MCYRRPHEPKQLTHHHMTRSNGSFLLYSPKGQRATRPFVAHANGVHKLLRAESPDRLLRKLLRQLIYEAASLRNHPVLLVDSAAYGTCAMSTLGEVYGE